jgi:hypothetical protein
MSDEFVEIPDVDEVQLVKIFENIAALISNSIETSPDIGGKTLAGIHYKLFLDFHENQNEKARLAIMFLQAQLGKLISDAGKSEDVGMLIYAYTRHWLRFVLILETQMASILSWYTSNPVLPINLVPLISSIEENLPINLDPKTSGLPEDTIKDFKEFADASNDDAGEELKNWLDSLMRETLFHKNEISNEILIQFQGSFTDLMEVSETNFEFNTLFHQYAESWFKEILERKEWIQKLIKELDLLDDKSILRMARGFYSIKFEGTSFSEIVKQRKASSNPT